jgi:hypothetical protein
MKKLLVTILFFLCMVSLVFAEGSVVQTGDGFQDYGQDMKIATFTITSDGGSVPNTAFLDANKQSIFGFYILAVEMYSATDDAFTAVITTALGSELFTFTTTAATSGHIANADDRWPIYSVPKIDVTSLAAGEVCTVIVTFVR